MKLFKLFIFCFITFSTLAQTGGEQSFMFLNLPTSARQLSLGGDIINIDDDINQPIWNPATINERMNNKIGVNYSSFLAGISLGSISYAKSISQIKGILYGNITYLDSGSLIGADEFGNETSNFSVNDLAISLGYSLKLPLNNFYFGANVKYINSKISTYNSTAFASDLGLYYNNSDKNYTFAFVARNIGFQTSTFNGIKENLPITISLGSSFRLEHVPLKWYFNLNNLQKWNISVPNPSNESVSLDGTVTEEDINFVNNALRHVSIGGELFPESAINLRLGYNFRRANELKMQNIRTFSGLSYGFGVKLKRLKFNYAFTRYHTATNVSTFSLQVDLNKNK